MEKKYWFVPKTYGWGLSPISWQGWVATLVYIGLVLAYLHFGYGIFNIPEDVTIQAMTQAVTYMIFDILVSGIAFVYLMESKTEGKVEWKWGK